MIHALALKNPPPIERRERYARMEPAEKAIWYAVLEVEKAGRDHRLTEAIRLMDQARKLVADYIDGIGDLP